MLEAIVFDFDGTIAETERLGHRPAYNAAFARAGLDWVWDDALYGELLAVGGGKERIAHYIERFGLAAAVSGDQAAFIGDLHRRKQQAFDELAPSIEVRPGIARLVTEARAAGVRLAIATTAAPAGVSALLACHPALTDAFEVIAAGDIVPHKKPAPDIYAYTLDRLGVEAQRAIAVEDAPIGLRAGLAAGMVTLVTESDYTRGSDFSGAAAVLSDLGEPDAPARVIAGIAPPRGYADVAYLRLLLERGSIDRNERR